MIKAWVSSPASGVICEFITESMEVRVHLMLGVRNASSNWTRAMALSYSVLSVEVGTGTLDGMEIGTGAGGAQNDSEKNMSRAASGSFGTSAVLGSSMVAVETEFSRFVAILDVITVSVSNGTDMSVLYGAQMHRRTVGTV